MQPEDGTTLYRLLTEEPAATLAVIVQGKPVTGLLPFVAVPDLLAVYIHASSLARHSAGLLSGAGFSLLIQATQEDRPDPHQIPRVSLEGEVRVFSQDGAEYQAARQMYIDKFPDSELLFSFQDFNLYRLGFTGGRFVAGFARAYNLSPQILSQIASAPSD